MAVRVQQRACEEHATQDSATLPEDTVAVEEDDDDVSHGWCSEDVQSQAGTKAMKSRK